MAGFDCGRHIFLALRAALVALAGGSGTTSVLCSLYAPYRLHQSGVRGNVTQYVLTLTGFLAQALSYPDNEVKLATFVASLNSFQGYLRLRYIAK